MGDDVEFWSRPNHPVRCRSRPRPTGSNCGQPCRERRDAMPRGGNLFWRPARCDLTKLSPTAADHAAGKYVQLAASDTASEWTSHHIANLRTIFHHKEVGKGLVWGWPRSTALSNKALDTSSSTANQSRTTFKIYLPARSTKSEVGARPTGDRHPKREGTTILLVEDTNHAQLIGNCSRSMATRIRSE